jgi:S-DNA-T family DNA segregation ATPase FtsK/SpoIIIE
MFKQSVATKNKLPGPPPLHPSGRPDPERAQQPPLSEPPYQPYAENPALSEPPYKPYAEKPAVHEPAYEPYKGV